MTDEQVEKVARAIYEAGIPKGGRDYLQWEDLESEGFYAQLHLAMKQAAAAIAAMGDGWRGISPELIDKLSKLATYLTEQGEYEACDLIDTVVERLTPKAKG
jgi:hypothetical protein